MGFAVLESFFQQHKPLYVSCKGNKLFGVSWPLLQVASGSVLQQDWGCLLALISWCRGMEGGGRGRKGKGVVEGALEPTAVHADILTSDFTDLT